MPSRLRNFIEDYFCITYEKSSPDVLLWFSIEKYPCVTRNSSTDALEWDEYLFGFQVMLFGKGLIFSFFKVDNDEY